MYINYQIFYVNFRLFKRNRQRLDIYQRAKLSKTATNVLSKMIGKHSTSTFILQHFFKPKANTSD